MFSEMSRPHWSTFLPLIVYGSIFILLLQRAPKDAFFCNRVRLAIQGHLRSMTLVPIERT